MIASFRPFCFIGVSVFWIGCASERSTQVTPDGHEIGQAKGGHLDSPSLSIQLGVDLAECRRCLASTGMVEIPTERVLKSYPFSSKLSFLAPFSVITWTDNKPRCNGWPTFMFAAFSDRELTNLVDLVEVRDGSKYPRVAGVYYRNLVSIRPGLGVQELYKKIGTDDCRFYQDSHGKWRVKFSYTGFRGETIAIEADAASGIIIVAQDRSI